MYGVDKGKIISVSSSVCLEFSPESYEKAPEQTVISTS